ncbi:hypothetical protein pb186bvf_011817 [Paramecium bursaria]
MSFLDRFKGRTQKIPRNGVMQLFGPLTHDTKNKTKWTPQDHYLLTINDQEEKLLQEIQALHLQYSQRHITQTSTPKSSLTPSTRTNQTAISSAKLLLRKQ